jgi:hypothetical protein
MIRFRFLPMLTLLSLSTLAFGAMGCSQGQSPTEPAFDTPVPAKSLAVSQDKRHGADDPAGDDNGGRQGRGADDPAGDDRGGRHGRGADDPAGDNRGGQRGGGQQRPPRAGQLEGAVSAVDAGAGTLTLAGGQRIAVNGQTQWNRRGDLFSLQQVAAAVVAGKPTRAEARGTRQADGTLLAQTIKAEVDAR